MGDVLLIFLIFLCVLLLSWVWKSFYTYWWRPMKLQRYLNQQGIHGHPYKLFYGNFKDLNRSTRQAQTQPINLTHKIVSRVLPFLDQTVKSYGMSWVTFLQLKLFISLFFPMVAQSCFDAYNPNHLTGLKTLGPITRSRQGPTMESLDQGWQWGGFGIGWGQPKSSWSQIYLIRALPDL